MKVLLLTGGEPRHLLFSKRVPHDYRIVGQEITEHITSWVLNARADVVIVYGTGKLPPELVRAAPYVLNLHGGDPERYRGLDTNLWALLDLDLAAVQVTLHHVDDSLDTGDIVFQTRLNITGVQSLAGLESLTTETCVQLALLALHGIKAGFLPRRPQRSRGRYYSRMPDRERERCEQRFRQLAA